jgi:hypothetical protein
MPAPPQPSEAIMSNEVGMRRGQASARGLDCIKITKMGKVGGRVCSPGDIVLVEGMNTLGPGGQSIVAPELDGLSEDHAERLIRQGRAIRHQLRSGEKAISVKAKLPEMLPSGNELDRLEAATDPRPAQAERAVTPRGKAAV